MKKLVNDEINIDSLKLRIPIDLVLVNYESGILDKWQKLNETTGEIVPLKKKKPTIKVPCIGYDYFYSIQYNRENRGVSNEYLYITINSKYLKGEYFKGITKDNIKQIYNEIMSHRVVGFEYDHFLNKSSCTDIEFKRDFYSTQTTYKDYLNTLRKLTPEKKTNKGYENYSGGIMWNKRTACDKSNPNIKFYDKDKELKNTDNWEFKSEYLHDWELQNLKRLEFNIKNKKHLNSLGINNTSLGTLLDLSQEEKEIMLRSVLGKVIKLKDMMSEETEQDTTKEMPPLQLQQLNALKYVLRQEKSISVAIDILTSQMSTENRYKYASKLNKLYEQYIKNTETETPELEANYKLWQLLKLQDLNCPKPQV